MNIRTRVPNRTTLINRDYSGVNTKDTNSLKNNVASSSAVKSVSVPKFDSTVKSKSIPKPKVDSKSIPKPKADSKSIPKPKAEPKSKNIFNSRNIVNTDSVFGPGNPFKPKNNFRSKNNSRSKNNPNPKRSINQNNKNSKEIAQWDGGPGLWKELHLRALNWDPVKNKDDVAFLRRFAYRIPKFETGCRCRSFYNKWKENNPPNYSKYFEWTIDLHNAVNKKLNKSTVTHDVARRYWTQINK
jgi:hypothetical protein